MSKIILVLIIASIIALFFYIELIVSRIYFDYKISAIGLKNFSLQDLVDKGKSVVDSSVSVIIKNTNNLNISFSGLYIELSYNGNTIAKSSSDLRNYSKVTILSNTQITFTEYLDIIVSQSLIDYITSKSSNQSPILNVLVTFYVFGFIKIKVKDNNITID